MRKEKSKNLIVIIGNGFDLAHNLKTGFNHFAEYYIDNILINKLFNYKENKSFFNKKLHRLIERHISVITDFHSFMSDEDFINTIAYEIQKGNKEKVLTFLKSNPNFIHLVISNYFFGKLYSNYYKNWFSIEQSYYEELSDILLKKSTISEIFEEECSQTDLLRKLNYDFTQIKESLKLYLKKEINPVFDNNIKNSLKTLFEDREEILVVNFNYTNTINLYNNHVYADLSKNAFINYHIHGNLANEIIFGYGDDTDENYQNMKNTKNKEYLRFFKTFDYLKKENYRQTLNALAVFKDYDSLIIGHSLDTTDKTILKTILDDEKCNNIELLKRSDLASSYLKQESHFELHANLSRIFTSEKDLREKIIPFSWSVNFPIMNKSDSYIIKERNNELSYKVHKVRLSAPSVH